MDDLAMMCRNCMNAFKMLNCFEKHPNRGTTKITVLID